MKILYLSPVPLEAQNDGVKIRGTSLARALLEHAEVRVLSFQEGGLGDVALPAQPSRWERLFSLEPSLFRCFRSAEFHQRVGQLAPDFDVCFCLGLQMTQYLSALPAHMPVVLDNFNVESNILSGLAERKSGLKRLFWKLQSWKLRRYEKRALRSVTVALAISHQDEQTFLKMAPGTRVVRVPPGLNLDPYLQAEDQPVPGRLVFVGALDWHVNVDAAHWMAHEVLPLIQAQQPEVELRLVGRRPSPEVRQLTRLRGVSLLSDVASVIPHLSQSQAVVVPLRFGSGVQTKVIEAMAAGRPVVTTPLGYEGLDVEAGRDLLVADGSQEFANSCLRLLNNHEAARQMGALGRQAVRQRYGFERLDRDVQGLLATLGRVGGK